MSPKEIEFKYDADKIDLKDFINFCKKLPNSEYSIVRGSDDFYANPKNHTDFYRHRACEQLNQLTFKRKLCKDNNYVRIEHNINLSPGVTKEEISSFCSDIGFKYNMTLIKTSFIFKTKKFTAVYYNCYNEDRVNIGRFIELEMAEDFPWKSEKQAFKELKLLEKRFRPLGINPRRRVKLSLYEMFKN